MNARARGNAEQISLWLLVGFDGEAVLERDVTELYAQLGDVASFTDRVRVADEYLCAKLSSCPAVSSIAKVANTILRRNGCVLISDMAREAGLGVRQFERRFQGEIGVPPKLYTRIVRFEAAIRHKAASTVLSRTDIAHTLRYFDQMHVAHDSNRLSGDAPTNICSQLDMFVQPEVLCDADRAGPTTRQSILEVGRED